MDVRVAVVDYGLTVATDDASHQCRRRQPFCVAWLSLCLQMTESFSSPAAALGPVPHWAGRGRTSDCAELDANWVDRSPLCCGLIGDWHAALSRRFIHQLLQITDDSGSSRSLLVADVLPSCAFIFGCCWGGHSWLLERVATEMCRQNGDDFDTATDHARRTRIGRALVLLVDRCRTMLLAAPAASRRRLILSGLPPGLLLAGAMLDETQRVSQLVCDSGASSAPTIEEDLLLANGIFLPLVYSDGIDGRDGTSDRCRALKNAWLLWLLELNVFAPTAVTLSTVTSFVCLCSRINDIESLLMVLDACGIVDETAASGHQNSSPFLSPFLTSHLGAHSSIAGPLQLAAANGNAEMVRLLLRRNISQCRRDRNGLMRLMTILRLQGGLEPATFNAIQSFL